MMAEHGLICCDDMVRAIQDGRKTQTRRLIVLPSDVQWQYTGKMDDGSYRFEHYGSDGLIDGCCFRKPRYQIGDLLWVKETWGVFDVDADEDVAIAYKAGPDDEFVTWFSNKAHILKGKYRLEQWRSGRFMFKDFARIWLKVTDVKAERLQDISEEDAIAEGVISKLVPYKNIMTGEIRNTELYYPAFCMVWKALHDKPGERWADNPWVFAYDFKRIEKGS